MAQTLSDLLTRVNELISDPKNQKFTEAQKTRALNTCLQDLVSSKLLTYVRSQDVQFRDGEYTYDFPEDMLEPVGIMIQTLTGQVMVNSSWKGLVGNLDFSVNSPYNSEVFWNITSQTGGKLILRDIVPANQFIVTPLYDADVEANTVVKQTTMPTSASEGTIWVDTLDDENLVYKANDDYTSATDYATLTVDSSLLAGTTDLVFTAVDPGIQNIQVSIAITTGAASMTLSGSGTRSDPYLVAIEVPTSASSNNAIIALASTSGKVTATGSSATTGTLAGLAATSLENDAEQYWTPQYIHVIYNAIYPKLYNSTDELDDSLPVQIREGDALPLMAAVKLLKMVRGDQRLLIMISHYTKEYEEVLERIRRHNALAGPPNDLEPV